MVFPIIPVSSRYELRDSGDFLKAWGDLSLAASPTGTGPLRKPWYSVKIWPVAMLAPAGSSLLAERKRNRVVASRYRDRNPKRVPVEPAAPHRHKLHHSWANAGGGSRKDFSSRPRSMMRAHSLQNRRIAYCTWREKQ